MRGQWTGEAMLQKAMDGPTPAGQPYLWQWNTVRQMLEEAGRALPESMGNRRSLLFNNPGLPQPTTTHTINMGVQQIHPGETAWSHRHSMTALRFIIEGSVEAETIVNGELCPMETFDLILTPSSAWHDHHNRASASVTWLDVLDVPLVLSLNQTFYQPGTQHSQAVSEGMHVSLGGLVRPAGSRSSHPVRSMRYPWRQIEPQLRALAEQDGSIYDAAALEYVNPMTGGSVLPSLGCWIQWVRPAEKTASHRHTSSAVYFVVRGHGRTMVGDVELRWGPRDCFVIPNWSWHSHENLALDNEAILFSVNDAPVLEALGLYREELGPKTRET